MPCLHRVLVVTRALIVPVHTVIEEGFPVDYDISAEIQAPTRFDAQFFSVHCQACHRTWRSSHKHVPGFVQKAVEQSIRWNKAEAVIDEAGERAYVGGGAGDWDDDDD